MLFLLFALVFVTSPMLVSSADLNTVYQWKYIDYIWESEASKQEAIDAGDYNYSQIIPMDVDKAPDGRVFISMIGRKGVPAVLATVTDKMGPSGPLVKPYPDWSYFKKGDCNSIQDVYRIAIDKCERLWVLDNGYVEKQPKMCEPQLLAFDLKTDRLVQRIKIPKHIARGQNGQTLLTTPKIETSGRHCEDTTVFIADAWGSGLIVFNNGNFSRLENPLFRPSAEARNITSGDITVEWNVGIVTMDISPSLFPNEPRFLYFHAMSSFDLYGADVEVLKRSTSESDIDFVGAKNVLSSQPVGLAFSTEGTLFMGLTKESGIACWNRYRKLERSNVKIVAEDDIHLQYINGMKTIQEPISRNEELWILSNQFLAFINNKLNFDKYNYRILKSSVKRLIAGTECDIPHEIKK